jgi:hypothetical protein
LLDEATATAAVPDHPSSLVVRSVVGSKAISISDLKELSWQAGRNKSNKEEKRGGTDKQSLVS